jgi:trimeric autotransporter adhesin
VTITASSEGRSGTSAVTVKPKPVGAVIISPAQVSVEVAQTRQLTAQVTDDQGNVLTGRPISYSTDNAAVATVSATGVVTGVTIGTTKITATSEGKTGSADVSVTAVPVATVEINPNQSTLTIGQQATLLATARNAAGGVLTGRPVLWTSGAPSVATVSQSGAVSAIGAGSAVIFATIEGKTASAAVNVRQLAVTSVTVAPASASLAVGGAVQLAATVQSGATVLTDRAVGWSSTNETIAVVSSTGRVTGLKAGVVTITATSEGVSGTAFVAVGISSVVVTPNPSTVAGGATRQLSAVARDAASANIPGVTFVWTSAATQTATVDDAGLVTGRAAGSTTIRATVGSVFGTAAITVTPAPVATITVTPSAPSVVRGNTVQLTATLRDAAGNVLTGRTVAWSTSAPLRVTVLPTSGLVVTASALSTGTAIITTSSEGKSTTTTVTVTAP